ncbi:MAG: glycosyltransferase family 2 protein [Candidatus Kaelpia aquatica]|nr:glycosyltransferase family 2 protein [Candidatus Kaelpia aquatica]
MIALSVVIITKNEEKNIKECIESVRGWADEIVIVDDNSSDRTRDMASEYTDKILVRKMDIEGRHRNWAYQQAKNEWVLSLDADERVTEELKQEIEEFLKSSPQAVACSIPRRNYIGSYWVKYGGWYPSPQLKMFFKDRFKWEESHVHPIAFVDGDTAPLKSDIIHYSYRDITDFINKLNNQTTLEVQKWVDQGKEIKSSRFLRRSIDRFLRSYFRKQGFKDGFYGFVLAYFASLYQFLSLIKYKELKRKT